MLMHLAADQNIDTQLLEPLATELCCCGQYGAAPNVCRQAARRMPDNPDPLIGIARYMRRLRRPAELILPVLP